MGDNVISTQNKCSKFGIQPIKAKVMIIYSGGGPVHARVPIHAHPQFS